MKPFLLVSTRPEEEALDSEYQAYSRATGLSRDVLELAEFDLVGLPIIEPNRYSGVFVAGSPYGGSAKTEDIPQRLKWIREELIALFTSLIEAEVPLVVTGNAMTTLTMFLGGKTSPEYAERAEVTDIEMTRDALEDPVMKDLPEMFPAYVNHSEAVDELPEDAVRLARSLNTPVQVYRWKDRVYALQFNAELDAESIRGQVQAYADAGDTGMGDLETLVTIGRHGSGDHAAAQILSNFVKCFATEG